MKKLMSLILVFCMIVPALVACDEKNSGIPAESTTGGTHPVDTDPFHGTGTEEPVWHPTDTVVTDEGFPDVPDDGEEKLVVEQPFISFAPEIGEVSIEFCTNLFRQSYKEGENVLVSPLSVLIALSMVEGGARGETLRQMEQVMGNGMRYESFAEGMKTLLESYSADEVLRIANGIWYKDGVLTPAEDFRALMTDVFDAPFRAGAFDGSTKDEINGWVEDNTDGMIDSIIEEIPEDAVMYLINALCFNGKWEKKFEKVSKYDFTNADGSVTKVDMMTAYGADALLFGNDAIGFMKMYEGGRYAFAALLPDEGITVDDYVRSLTGEELRRIFDTRVSDTNAFIGLPKFKVEYKCDMMEPLTEMGITNLFGMAELYGLGDCSYGPMAVSGVFHKTFMEVDEAGTKAAAVTAIEVYAESCVSKEVQPVVLDRPFVYMIMDTATGLPLFMGVMENME